MTVQTVDEVETGLTELLQQAVAEDLVLILREGMPLVSRTEELPKGIPVFGRGKGQLIEWIDDEEHLKDFAEYMT